MLYPTYVPNELGNSRIIGQAPLVRVKMMNLITKERTTPDHIQKALGGDNDSLSQVLGAYQTSPMPENGVLAAIGNITYRSDLQKIQMFEKAANTVLPQSLSVTLGFDVIHEETLGWGPDGKPLASSFPIRLD